jgi:aryl-alcohol dehydrogenase-like predicted oxidoreductase
MFIFQTHLWDDATPIEETLRTLDDLVRCGKVRYTGACNLVGWQMQKVVLILYQDWNQLTQTLW